LGTGIAQLGVGLMYLLAARDQDARAFGAMVSALAFATALVGVVDWGSNNYWVRELAAQRAALGEVGARARTKVCAGALAIPLAGLACATTHLGIQWLEAAFVFAAVLAEQTATVGLRVGTRLELVGLVFLLDRAVATGTMLVFLAAGVPGSHALSLGLAIGAGAGCVAALLLDRRHSLPLRAKPFIRNPWAGSGAFGVATTATTLQSLDVFVLSASAGPASAGLYGAINRWTQPLGLLVSAYAQSIAPAVARAHGWRASWAAMRSAIWLPCAAALGCVVAALFSPALVALLLTTTYSGSARLLSVLAIGTIPAIANQILSVTLQARGHQSAPALLLLLGVTIQLLTVSAVGSHGGAMTAAIAFLAMQIFLLVGLSVSIIRAVRR
jgi:O-antigen/teichoic acid export membrane protein